MGGFPRRHRKWNPYFCRNRWMNSRKLWNQFQDKWAAEINWDTVIPSASVTWGSTPESRAQGCSRPAWFNRPPQKKSGCACEEEEVNTQALGASRSCGVLNKQQSRAQHLSMATRCGDHRGTVHAQGAASRAPARSTVSGWPGDPGGESAHRQNADTSV